MNYLVADKRAKSPEWPSQGKRLGFHELGRMARSVLVAARDWGTGRRLEDAASTHGAYAQAAVETSNRPSSEISFRRYPLVRYLLGTTVVAMIAVFAVAAFLHLRSAERVFSDQALERSAMEVEHIAHIFYYTVWVPVHMEFSELSFARTVHPQMMDVFARRSTYGLSVVKLNIWDLDGTLLWSSDPTDPSGRIAVGEWYSTVVKTGAPVTELLGDHQVVDLIGEERRLNAIRTYHPFRDGALDAPESGEIVGVLEITQDVTTSLAAAKSNTVRSVAIASAGAGIVLFTLLMLAIFRADRNIAMDYRQLLRRRGEAQGARDQEMQSTKLAGIGQLVAGVAHELNNPLSSIWGLAQLLKERDDKDLDPQVKRELAMIHQEAERSVRIVQNLLSFSRAEGAQKDYTSINSAIEAALELRRYHLMVNNVHLQVQLQPDLPRTMADPHKIQQVILNLIVNAEQAMLEANDSGNLAVMSEKVGQSIRIVVSDDGPGIPQEHLNTLFDPFFTTKAAGTGTGLGLSICHTIIREHGGVIRVESEPEKGTSFILELPIVGSGGSVEPNRI